MNYFAHAVDFLDEPADPYFVAGLAVPDWMNVVDRKIRARSKAAESFLQAGVPESCDRARSVARGIIQHHQDDQWFHATQDFAELSLQFSVQIRNLLGDDQGFRPGFLGHILVELLLDDALIRRYPERIERYYELISLADAGIIGRTVGLISGKNVDNLSWFIRRFGEIRFLLDYRDNQKLLGRLNQVMQRVKLPALPESMTEFFDQARTQIEERIGRLFFEPRTPARCGT